MAIGKLSSTAPPKTGTSSPSYLVRAGDSLSRIARRHGLGLAELLAANPQIKNPDRIAVGQSIQIPAPSSSQAPPKNTAPSSAEADAFASPKPGVDTGRRPAARPEINATGVSRQNGTLGLLAQKKAIDQAALNPVERQGQSDPFHGTTAAFSDAVKGVGPQEIKKVDGLRMLEAVGDANLQIELPLKPGKYKVRGVSFKVEPGTVMKVQVQVRDGKLVPARDRRGRDTGGGSKVEIEPPLDLPLWITGDGVYLRDRGRAQAQLKADLGGFFDLNVSKKSGVSARDLVASFATPQGQPGSAGSSPARASSAAKKASPLPPGLVDFGAMRFRAADVKLKNGLINAGSARIQLGAGSQVELVGDGRSSELRGQVKLDGLQINDGQRQLSARSGKARISIKSRATREGGMRIDTRIDGLRAEIDGYQARPDRPRDGDEHLRVGPSQISDGSIQMRTHISSPRDGSLPKVLDSQTSIDLRVKGHLDSAKLAVRDADDDAIIELGPGSFDGRIQSEGDIISAKGAIRGGQFSLRDMQNQSGQAALDVHHLNFKGDLSVDVDGRSGNYKIEADARDLDLRVDDYRGTTERTDIDIGRTDLNGQAHVEISRHGGVQIDGDLSIDGSIDDLKVRRDQGTAIALAGGSTLKGQVSHFSAGGEKGFELDGRAKVDLGLEGFRSRMPGVEVIGGARVEGETDVHIQSGQVFFTDADARVRVRVHDGKVAPGGKGFNLDLGEGSTLDLNFKEFKSSSVDSEDSLVLGQGSRLEAVLDSGEITLGDRSLQLDKGSRARFDIDSLVGDGKGLPQLRGRLQIDASLSAEQLKGSAKSVSGVQVKSMRGARSRARIRVDDVTLGSDGRFALDGVGIKLDAQIDAIRGAVGVGGSKQGKVKDPPKQSLDPFMVPEHLRSPLLAGTSPMGTLASDQVQAMSAAAIAGASVEPGAYDPMETLKRIDNGNIKIVIPVEGRLGEGWLGSADFEPGTTLTLNAQVRDGQIDLAKTRASFSKSGDGPMWVTVRGVAFDKQGTLRLDLGGMKDFAVPGFESMPSDVEAFVGRLQSQEASSPSADSSSIPSALKLGSARIDVQQAHMKPGPLPLPGGSLQVAQGTTLSIHGDTQRATLKGRVAFDRLDLATDGVALKSGAGSADLEVQLSRTGQEVQIETRLDKLSLDLEYGVHRRSNGDYIHLAQGKVQGASLHSSTTMQINRDLKPELASNDVNLDIPHFTGRIEGARATVPDSDGTATIEFGRSEVEGRISVVHNRIELQGTVKQLDAVVRDLAATDGGNGVDLAYAHLQGQGEVSFGQDQGLNLAATVDQIGVRARDIKGQGQGYRVDAGTTTLSGSGRAFISSTGEIDIEGDLFVDSSLDSARFDGHSIGAEGDVELAAGSHLAARVSRVHFDKSGTFELKGDGGVDLTIDNFKARLPGIEAQGTARVQGGGAFEIDSTRGLTLPKRLQVDIALDDGALDGLQGQAALDLAKGSTLRLNLRQVDVGKNGSNAQVELGPGSRLAGALDGGRLQIPGLRAPLQVQPGSSIEIDIEDLLVDERGVQRAQGRLRLRTEVRLADLDETALAQVGGVTLHKTQGGRATLTVEVDRVRVDPDGQIELLDTQITLDARLQSVQGSTRPD